LLDRKDVNRIEWYRHFFRWLLVLLIIEVWTPI